MRPGEYVRVGDPQADEVVAAADLVGRSGGRSFEVGYLNDDPPHEWYATATYRGARVIAQGHDDPGSACDALAAKILTGGQCTHCGRTVAITHSRRVADRCVWTRTDERWQGACKA
jgi:hypothetical protein